MEAFAADPTAYLATAGLDDVAALLDRASEAYFNEKRCLLPDEAFDLLVDFLGSNDPHHPALRRVGAAPSGKRRVALPHHMGSLDKVKAGPGCARQLERFRDLHPGRAFCVSDKLDGVSALLVVADVGAEPQLFTRGDGTTGTDVSHLLSLIRGVPAGLGEGPLAVRGELIMSKPEFERLLACDGGRAANARNLVSGIVVAKAADARVASAIEFVAYELVSPWERSQARQFAELSRMGFAVVAHEALLAGERLDEEWLVARLRERRANGEYRVDGLVVSRDALPDARCGSGNPDYAVAFKENAAEDAVETEVLGVEWNVSKDGYYRPRLRLRPVQLRDVWVSAVTAFNARYVVDNCLGAGARVRIVRSGDVIPHIVEVTRAASRPELPDDYAWDATQTNILTRGETPEQGIRTLALGCRRLGIKHVDVRTACKLTEGGVDSLTALLACGATDFARVPGFQSRTAERLAEQVAAAAERVTLVDFAVASNAFGHGIGAKKLERVFGSWPRLVEEAASVPSGEVIDRLRAIDGIELVTATAIEERLARFATEVERLPAHVRERLRGAPADAPSGAAGGDKTMEGQTVVFTGFRDAELERAVADAGGRVTGSVSAKTTLVVTRDAGDASGKTRRAGELGIRVVDARKLRALLSGGPDSQ